MSQRVSGYDRKENDLYETPAWVTNALLPHLPRWPRGIFEPASGGGKIVEALRVHFDKVIGVDKSNGHDFLMLTNVDASTDTIITNPPFNLATEFIQHSLELMKPRRGVVAMLLRTDFDHAATRANLFQHSDAFCKKVVLTKRIRWFENTTGSPSMNHAWFIWDWRHEGAPTLAYGP